MRILLVCLSIAVLGMMFSCKPRIDYAGKIEAIHSISNSVDSATIRFSTIDKEAVNVLFSLINQDIGKLESMRDSIVEVDKDMARILSLYRAIPRNVKNFGRRYQRLESEIIRTKNQLGGLKEALEMKATKDADGNEMTPEYVDKVFGQEMKVARQLIDEIDEMIDRLHVAEKQYEGIKDEADSVLTVLGVREE